MTPHAPLKFFVSAGEASGDIHAAGLIRELRRQSAGGAEFIFLGGDLMAEAAGHAPLIHYRHMAYMGFAEVIRHLPDVRRNLATAREAIAAARPDALILVDYPSFNLRLAAFARSLGIPVYYYISPKVWAWKEWRVKAMRRYCRMVLTILPFEVEYFRDKQLRAEYVGNPSAAEIDAAIPSLPDHGRFCMEQGLDPNRPILAIVPGSRRGEINGNLPVMARAALRFPSLQPVIAAAPGIENSFYKNLPLKGDPQLARKISHMPLVRDASFALMRNAVAALVTSGTATLECALLGTPQVVCYRSNGRRWFYSLMSHALKCPHVSLPNLIANGLNGPRFANEVVPELLIHHVNPDEISHALADIIPGAPGRRIMLDGYERMRRRLAGDSAPKRAAELILEDLY